jgi:transposase
MRKYFRPWNIDQTLLLPPNVQDFVPKDHVSRFIVELVPESLDLKEITGSYVSGLGQPPFDPRMMVALLLHSYASGLYSSRRIARACCERNDFVMIVALDPPDFRTISDFRKRHLKALGALFLQVLKLCETAGLVKLGHVALDGTKIKANASKHKAMSYERMKKREMELKAEIARMLAAAEAADSEEDETFGKDKRGDELPDWAGDKQKRLAKIQQAMAALEADARLAAEEERRIEAEKEQQRQAEGRKKPGKPAAPPSDEPDPKSQRNFTDPESRIMKSKDGFVQAYNAQAAVDAGAQIIVAHELTQCGNDQGQLVPLIEAIENNLGRKPEQAAPGRAKHPTAANGKIGGPLTQRMRQKIDDGGFETPYRLRKQVVEPVFGQIKQARGFRQFLLRGVEKVRAEWAMICTAHNLQKLFTLAKAA